MRPARVYLLVAGLYLVVSGIVGFTLDASFPTSAHDARGQHAHIFGIFETNGWHNLAALAIGVPSLAVALLLPRHAAVTAALAGLGNGVTFLLFLAWEAETFWVASNTADQVVHATLAVGGLVTALLDSRHRLSSPVLEPEAA